MEENSQLVLFPKFSDEQKEKAELQIIEQQKIVDYEIREYTIELLVNKYMQGKENSTNDIFIPYYQREFVWDEKKQSKFIESLLLGLPIPYMFTADKDGRSEIVDGSQRIRTLEYFLNNKFALTGLEKLNALEGFRFLDLPLSRQKRFKKKTIRLIELTDKADYEVRREIFSRINTTPTLLTETEIRRGVHQGELMDFITICAKNPKFEILCPISNKRQNRYEYELFVSRYFAYSEDLDNFSHLVENFVNEYIDKVKKNFDKAQGDRMLQNFEDMLDFVDAYFPYGFKKTPNHRSTPRVRFEAIAVGVTLALRENPQLKPAIPIKNWLESKEFEEHVTSDAANNKSKVLGRINFVKDKLLGKA